MAVRESRYLIWGYFWTKLIYLSSVAFFFLVPHVIHKLGLWQALLFKFHRPALFHCLFKQDPSRRLPQLNFSETLRSSGSIDPAHSKRCGWILLRHLPIHAIVHYLRFDSLPNLPRITLVLVPVDYCCSWIIKFDSKSMNSWSGHAPRFIWYCSEWPCVRIICHCTTETAPFETTGPSRGQLLFICCGVATMYCSTGIRIICNPSNITFRDQGLFY